MGLFCPIFALAQSSSLSSSSSSSSQSFPSSVNFTNKINIEVATSEKKMLISYYITETFNSASHGIFLALPLNQGGVKTDYSVKSVEFKKASQTQYQTESYQQIKETDQFRFRVGDPNTTITGQYDYKILVEASYDSGTSYTFSFVKDWLEYVDQISLKINGGKNECLSTGCSSAKISFDFNPNSQTKGNYFLTNVQIYGLYGFIVILIYAVIYTIWFIFAKDPNTHLIFDKPEFEPPADITPWQAQILISEGNFDFKNTFLSFLLWLNSQRYIEIVPPKDTDTMDIKILKPIPRDLLPPVYTEAIEKMEEFGIEEGLKLSKLNQVQHGKEAFDMILESLRKYYVQKPFYKAWSISLVGFFVCIFLLLFAFDFIRDTFLIGESFRTLAVALIAVSFPGMLWLLAKWAKLNRQGAEIRAHCIRYRYYLEKAEKYKLDFSNNPTDGVQFYLKSVPFASAFGILPQFQKYINEILPNNPEIKTGNDFWLTMSVISFYTPPSTSSGGSFGGGGGGFSGGGGSW